MANYFQNKLGDNYEAIVRKASEYAQGNSTIKHDLDALNASQEDLLARRAELDFTEGYKVDMALQELISGLIRYHASHPDAPVQSDNQLAQLLNPQQSAQNPLANLMNVAQQGQSNSMFGGLADMLKKSMGGSALNRSDNYMETARRVEPLQAIYAMDDALIAVATALALDLN